jgi:hypothetical protein
MKQIVSTYINIFTPEDFKGFCFNYGVSIYKDVVVIWDEDFDTRIITLLDNIIKEDKICMSDCYINQFSKKSLIAVSEREGHLDMLWDHPMEFNILGKMEEQHARVESINVITPSGGDTWSVEHHFCNTKKYIERND